MVRCSSRARPISFFRDRAPSRHTRGDARALAERPLACAAFAATASEPGCVASTLNLKQKERRVRRVWTHTRTRTSYYY